MNKERKKQIRLDAVIKVQNFLEQCKHNIENGISFSTDKLARSLHTSGSTATHAVRLGILKQGEIKGEFHIGENFGTDRTTAKKIIESIRLQDIERKSIKYLERSQTLISESKSEGTTEQKERIEQDSVPKIQSNTAHEIASILKKAIPQQTTNLFSDQEKEFDDKLKIACAIASGLYSDRTLYESQSDEWFANGILRATNEIYSKLKNNK